MRKQSNSRGYPKASPVNSEARVTWLHGEVHCGRNCSLFIDARGKIKSKGNPDKLIAIGALEKQLYREKTIMKCMFPPPRIIEMDHLAASSGIAKCEGLVDDPPEE